ncbi:MAG: hypothetical protein GY796_31880 [Chloroflexi bacterium]|nr:hypothetical protein [Chloroflexota bacterium]
MGFGVEETAVVKVMMFHIGRSGSQVLGDMLQQHPHLFWDHEVYIHQLQAARIQGLASPQGNPVLLLQERLERATATMYGAEVKFFHLRLFQMPLPEFFERLLELGFLHFVVLKRKNYLRKVVSSLVAQQTKQWHQQPGQPQVLTPIDLNLNRVSIDWAHMPLLAHLAQYAQDFAAIQMMLEPFSPLNLIYEDDILLDPQIGYAKCCHYLNIDNIEVIVRYGRSNPFPLREIITNYAEVAGELNGTPFEWMLSDEE